jgi:acyl-CoA thioester hydrolase
MSDPCHNYKVRVFYEDTDAGGIVYYANYLKFSERGRTQWLRELGINQSTLLEQNIGFVVSRVEMDNIASAKLDDLLNVNTVITRLKSASLVFTQQITNQKQQLLTTLVVRVACIKPRETKPCGIPKKILGVFKSVS